MECRGKFLWGTIFSVALVALLLVQIPPAPEPIQSFAHATESVPRVVPTVVGGSGGYTSRAPSVYTHSPVDTSLGTPPAPDHQLPNYEAIAQPVQTSGPSHGVDPSPAPADASSAPNSGGITVPAAAPPILPSGWAKLSVASGPSPRENYSMVFDPSSGETVLFGGYDGAYLSDTWAYSHDTWSKLSLSSGPSARAGSSVTYDPANGAILLFGGYNGAYLSDTWEFVNGTWIKLNPTSAPPGRDGASMVFDQADGYILLFGGYNGGYLSDTWEFSGGNWVVLGPAASPHARSGASATFDIADGYVVLFGGYDGGFLADTWTFRGGVWTQMLTSKNPSPRNSSAMAFDSSSGTVMLFGGYNGSFLSDTWTYDSGTWSSVPQTLAPTARSGASLSFDAATGLVLLFGGTDGASLGDTWAFRLSTTSGWTQEATGSIPLLYGSAETYDYADGYLLLFGGYSGLYAQDTWEYKNGLWELLGTPVHGPVVGSSECYAYRSGANTSTIVPCPSARYGASMTFDQGEGKALLFGGYNGSFLNDTWSFNGGIWTLLSHTSPPVAREFSSMTYDPRDGYALLFGGFDGAYLSDTWTYEGSSWIQVSPMASPTSRSQAMMDYDEASGYVVLFGGYGCETPSCAFYTALGGTWTYQGGNWTNATTGQSPSERYGGALAYDQSDGYLLLFGGYGCTDPPTCSSFGGLSDDWIFYNSTWFSYSLSTGPSARYDAAAAYDPAGGYVVITDGYVNAAYVAGTWTYTYPIAVSSFRSSSPGADVGESVTFNLTAFGGVQPYEYSYSGVPFGCTQASTSGWSCKMSTPGHYSVVGDVEDATGYQLSDETNLTVYSDPSVQAVTASRTALDTGQALTLTAVLGPGSDPFGEYRWSQSGAGLGCPDLTNASIVCYPTEAGQMYTVNVSFNDTDGFVSPPTESQLIKVYSDPMVTTPIASSPTADVGEKMSFSATLENSGSGSLSYSWAGLPEGCSSADQLNIGPCNVTTPGTFTVVLTAVDSDNFSYSSSAVVVIVYSDPAVGPPIPSRTSADVGQYINFSSNVTGGQLPYTYYWSSTPSGLNCTPTESNSSLSCHPWSEGNYSVSLYIVDGSRFTSFEGSLNTTVYPDPAISRPRFSYRASDVGQDFEVNVTVPSYGSGGYEVSWATSSPELACASVTATAGVCSASVKGTYNVTATLKDSNGLTATSTSGPVLINADPQVTVVVLPGGEAYIGERMTFIADISGGTPLYNVTWTGLPGQCSGNGYVENCTQTEGGNFSYYVTVEDSRGTSAVSSTQHLEVQGASMTYLASGAGWYFTILAGAIAIAAVVSAMLAPGKTEKD